MSETATRRKERSAFDGGLASALNPGVMVGSVIGLLYCVWVVIDGERSGMVLSWMVWMVAFVFRFVLRALAEGIRVLKKGRGCALRREDLGGTVRVGVGEPKRSGDGQPQAARGASALRQMDDGLGGHAARGIAIVGGTTL